MTKMPPAKCLYCKGSIPRDGTVKYVALPNRRYAHKQCVEEKENTEALRNQVLFTARRYLRSTYRENNVVLTLDKMIAEGKTYIGILRTLKYWYEVKNGDFTKANGNINIVNYIYDEAQEYYNRIEAIQEKNKNINEDFISNVKTSTYYVRPKPIQKPKRVKLFNLQ